MAEQNDVLSCSIEESTVYKAINTLGFSSLKPQQMMAISAFIERRDVFVVPPTGFGKTLHLLHPSCNELYPSANYFDPGFRRRWQIGHANPWSYYVVREIVSNFNYIIK